MIRQGRTATRLIASSFMLMSLVLSVAPRAGEAPSQRLYVPEDKKYLHSPGPPSTNDTPRPWANIQTAIKQGDLSELTRLLPADAVARRRALRESSALSYAFSAQSLPIVQAILSWDPLGMQALKSSKEFLLTQLCGAGGGQPPASDQVELVRILLDAGANPEGSAPRYSHISALGSLAYLPESAVSVATARLLLERGASVDKSDHPRGLSPLVLAAGARNVQLVHLMLELRKPAHPSLDEALMQTPFEASNEIIADLLAHGANVNARRTEWRAREFTPLWSAASSRDQRALLQLLIRYKADPNVGPSGAALGMPSALVYVMHDHELMQQLLELGADPNYRDSSGSTPLLAALSVPGDLDESRSELPPGALPPATTDPHARARSVQLLLQFGADPNLASHYGRTPLLATRDFDSPSIELLLDGGAKVVSRNTASHPGTVDHLGPLSIAILEQGDTVAAALLKRGQKVGWGDCAALFHAAEKGAIQTLSLLLDRRMRMSCPTANGDTPLIAAARAGQQDSVRLLLDRKVAKVNESTRARVAMLGNGHGPSVPGIVGGQTALMAAAQANRAAVVEELLARGASLSKKDHQGRTALDYADAAYGNEAAAVIRKYMDRG